MLEDFRAMQQLREEFLRNYELERLPINLVECAVARRWTTNPSEAHSEALLRVSINGEKLNVMRIESPTPVVDMVSYATEIANRIAKAVAYELLPKLVETL